MIENTNPGFAPKDLTDDRKLGEWESSYPKLAKRKIFFESIYLLVLLFSVPALLVLMYKGVIPEFLDDKIIKK